MNWVTGNTEPQSAPQIVQMWEGTFGIQQECETAREYTYLYSLHGPFPYFLGTCGETRFLICCSDVTVGIMRQAMTNLLDL